MNRLMRLRRPVHRVRQIHNKVDGLLFRDAAPSDKDAILSLRQNVYRGLDYLPEYFDFFIHDTNRRCVVGEINQTVVAFGVMLTLDGGQSILGQAGRVHQQHEGRGIFGSLSRYFNCIGKQNGSRKRVALVETTLNRYARSERFRQSHTPIASKLQYAGVITHDIRVTLENKIKAGMHTVTDIHAKEITDLELFFNSQKINSYLFPRNIILVDYVPLCASGENIILLKGRNTQFYSNLNATHACCKGLLSAGTTFRCINPPESYTIDIFGNDADELEKHVLFHLSRALNLTSGPFCLQIFVEKGYIAETLCKTLIKHNIPKCDWYVEGGVTTKTVVEEIFH